MNPNEQLCEVEEVVTIFDGDDADILEIQRSDTVPLDDDADIFEINGSKTIPFITINGEASEQDDAVQDVDSFENDVSYN